MAEKWGLEKHGRKLKKESKKKAKKKNSKGCSVVAIFMAAAIFAGIGGAIGGLFGFLETSGDINLDEYMIKNISTVFYDKDGKQIGVAHGGENRTLVTLQEVPWHLQKAVIAIEDERFHEHNGIDYKRTAGAIFEYIKTFGKGTYGASTITQQLIKNATDDKEKSPVRKIREWWRATLLERELSKEQILELYLNTIYFGHNAYGVQAASNVFFDKDVKDLTLAESAMLAGVTNLPGKYSPIINMENSIKRQKIILNKMHELGYIDKKMYDEAIAEKIVLKRGAIKNSSTQSYFVDMVIEDVLSDLETQKGITRAMASKMVYGGGLKIYTTMDSGIQEIIDEVYIEQDAEVFKAFSKQKEQPQSAMTIVDYKNGYIVGVIGGRGEKKVDRAFNRATQAYRQPGSTIKPLAVYGPALNDGTITAATIIADTPVTVDIPGSQPWTPVNWYSAGYYGNITMRYAVEQSANIPAVKTLLKVGIDRAYSALKDAGITTLQQEDKNYAPLSLGGLNRGITVREWASAYGMIANGGVYNKPVTYTRVEDSKGQILLQTKKISKKVMSPEAAYIMTDVLKGVVTQGTARSAKLSSMISAGKTGSTSSNNDKWYVGYTPYYVGAVWVGYDDPKSIEVGGEISKQIWKKVMEKVHANLTSIDFTMPSGVENISICKSSGLKNTVYCGNNVKTELFTSDTVPINYCNVHGIPIYTPPVQAPNVPDNNSEYPEGL